MPISRDEFERGELDPSLFIVDFLRSSPDYAYTLEELIAELASRGMDLAEEDLQDILSSLETRGRIESKTRRSMVYYIYRKPKLGFR
ncbi:MAG: hypothetical protein IBX36_04025 [Dehalococcoidia bacterium]|nr:hypothetical protein [Dehalococcoidia bacterium]